MEKLKYLIFILMFLVTFYGCSKSDNNTPTNALGLGDLGGGGTGNVTIGVDVTQDNQGQQYFVFTPNTDVVVIQAEVQCTAQQIDQTFQGDGQTVYSANNGFTIGPLTDGLLQTGQKWNFTIQGKVGSSTGTAFTAAPTYTVP